MLIILYQTVNDEPLIYFDNAATTFPRKEVIEKEQMARLKAKAKAGKRCQAL